MSTCMDLLNWLEPDTIAKIFTCLDDPSDLVRVGAVSRSWRQFVVENGFCKQLCLRMFPQLSRVFGVVEVNRDEREDGEEVGTSSNCVERENMAREHRVYASLARYSVSVRSEECISEAISASSTDNDPEESVVNTLERDVIPGRATYWSSTGHENVKVPETLIYKLVSNLCVITEIGVQPYKAYFQPGFPTYSARAVRFRMGHLKSPDSIDESCDDKFVWTYTSQEFQMEQKNCLQKFKLPKPVLFIGGYLQVELLGRVQRQEMDDLYYICISRVQVEGHSLAPRLDAKVIDPSGKVILKYDLKPQTNMTKTRSFSSTAGNLERRVRTLEQIVELLRGNEFYGWHGVDEEFLL